MSKLIIEGGYRLHGEVTVNGSKNVAFPVLAASLLSSSGVCEIKNVPEITDVENFLAILSFLGAKIDFFNHRVTVNAQNIKNLDIPLKLTSKLRGSVVLAGALLARFGRLKMGYPGGDAIGNRPIDVHLSGLAKLGAKNWQTRKAVKLLAKGGLHGTKIVLSLPSVTATENLILASVLAKGMTDIRLAATEPHVQALCHFLNQMGAKIVGIGTTSLKIEGVKKLKNASFVLPPDEIEAMTFAVAAAATRGEVLIRSLKLQSLDAPLDALERMGVSFETAPPSRRSSSADWLKINKTKKTYRATKITTGIFPQLLTDFQPLFGVLATQASGQTLIHDWIYEGRQGYLKILQKMGATVEFEDLHRASIFGPSRLYGAEIKAPDLRAGASILIAALLAKGQSILYNAEIIDRGYERLDERLKSLGARIKRVD